MQIKLSTLGKWLVLISIVLCGLVVGIGVARGGDAVDMVKVGISLAVSVIPEGLKTLNHPLFSIIFILNPQHINELTYCRSRGGRHHHYGAWS